MARVNHIALLKFREGISEEQINRVFEELLDISENVPGIENFVSGTNTSPEGLNQGYTHGFIMTFADTAARDGYLGHPERDRIKAGLLPLVDSTIVFDFEI